MQEYYRPYFLSGTKKYVERGDVFVVEDVEMFVLNSWPDNGFIGLQTNAHLKFGLSKQQCLNKIHSADDRFTTDLVNMEQSEAFGEIMFNEPENVGHLMPSRRNLDDLFREMVITNRVDSKHR